MDFLHTHPKKNAVERETQGCIFSDLELGRKKMLKIRQIDEHVQTVKDLEGEPEDAERLVERLCTGVH